MSTNDLSRTHGGNAPQKKGLFDGEGRPITSNTLNTLNSMGRSPRIAFVIAVASPLLALFFLFGRRELGLSPLQIPKEVLTLSSEQANERIRGDLLFGQQITVHFEVWLANESSAGPTKGKLIESTRQTNKPFTFSLGSGQVFQGWDKAIAPMQLGEKRTVYIPADEAYGKEGIRGKIPPNSGLILEVEVLERSQ